MVKIFIGLESVFCFWITVKKIRLFETVHWLYTIKHYKRVRTKSFEVDTILNCIHAVSGGGAVAPHCAYPTCGTGNGDSNCLLTLDLYRKSFLILDFQTNTRSFLLIITGTLYPENNVWFHSDLKVLDKVTFLYWLSMDSVPLGALPSPKVR